MNTTPLIVPQIEISAITLPSLEQFPPECQIELIQALAALLLDLPLLQDVQARISTQGASNEQPS
jgi:hypothetical protein